MARLSWQLRMLIAEAGLGFWFWLASKSVPVETLERFSAFTNSLPSEPDTVLGYHNSVKGLRAKHGN